MTALFGNHQGGNDVNYEAAFQKRKQAPWWRNQILVLNPSYRVRTGKETDYHYKLSATS